MSLWVWGSDVYGRLGLGAEDKHRAAPAQVEALNGAKLHAATCGSAHNVVFDSSRGQCYTWGKCHYGQLGHGEMDQNELLPRPVEALRGVRVASLGAGDSHVLAVSETGEVFSWGVGFYGTLGHGDEVSLPRPRLVQALKGERVTQAAGGAFHSIAVTAEGKVFVWGRNHFGQIGLPPVEMPDYSTGGAKTKLVYLSQKSPTQVTTPPVKMVAACNDHSLLLLVSGEMVSFGANESGQLGRPTSSHKTDITSQLIDPATFNNPQGLTEEVTLIAAGYNHCAAVTKSGLLFTWGEGKLGQLGQALCTSSPTPSLVTFPGKQPVQYVSCGESFTVVLTANQELWSFGASDYGKLGLHGDRCVNTPKKLTLSGQGINQVCCGTNHTIAYKIE